MIRTLLKRVICHSAPLYQRANIIVTTPDAIDMIEIFIKADRCKASIKAYVLAANNISMLKRYFVLINDNLLYLKGVYC